MSHSSGSGPTPVPPTGGAGHSPGSPPTPHHGFPGGTGPQYPVPGQHYPGQYPAYPGWGYPYPPPGTPMPPVMFPPVYPSPPAARGGSLKPLWITLGVVISLLVVLCVGCSLLFTLSLSQLTSNLTTLNIPLSPPPAALDPLLEAANFCGYEINEDYADAYRQLSTGLQSQVSAQQFETDNQARDASVGGVVGCSAASESTAAADQASAPSPTNLTLNIWLGTPTGHAPPHNLHGTMTMVQQSSGWKVDAIDNALQLT